MHLAPGWKICSWHFVLRLHDLNNIRRHHEHLALDEESHSSCKYLMVRSHQILQDKSHTEMLVLYPPVENSIVRWSYIPINSLSHLGEDVVQLCRLTENNPS